MSASVSTSVVINADQSTAWKFLSDQSRFLAWMTFIPGAPTPAGSTFEPRPGGALRIIFPNGGEAKGQVLEVDPPRKLVFTWGYAPDVAKTGLGPGASRVEVVLTSVTDGTMAALTHTGPMSERLAQEHLAGWRHYLSQLALQGSMEFHQQRLPDTLAAYFSACNEPDQAKRDNLLASCCEQTMHVRTPFACSDTVEAFSANIANGLRHMGSAISAQNGPVNHIHGYARVPWKVSTPDGKMMFKGENFVRFTARAKIAEIVSFHG